MNIFISHIDVKSSCLQAKNTSAAAAVVVIIAPGLLLFRISSCLLLFPWPIPNILRFHIRCWRHG